MAIENSIAYISDCNFNNLIGNLLSFPFSLLFFAYNFIHVFFFFLTGYNPPSCESCLYLVPQTVVGISIYGASNVHVQYIPMRVRE